MRLAAEDGTSLALAGVLEIYESTAAGFRMMRSYTSDSRQNLAVASAQLGFSRELGSFSSVSSRSYSGVFAGFQTKCESDSIGGPPASLRRCARLSITSSRQASSARAYSMTPYPPTSSSPVTPARSAQGISAVRLVSGRQPRSGRLQVLPHWGEGCGQLLLWGGVNGSYVNHRAANAACRSMGWPGAVNLHANLTSILSTTAYPPVLNGVRCGQHNSTFPQCSVSYEGERSVDTSVTQANVTCAAAGASVETLLSDDGAGRYKLPSSPSARVGGSGGAAGSGVALPLGIAAAVVVAIAVGVLVKCKKGGTQPATSTPAGQPARARGAARVNATPETSVEMGQVSRAEPIASSTGQRGATVRVARAAQPREAGQGAGAGTVNPLQVQPAPPASAPPSTPASPEPDTAPPPSYFSAAGSSPGGAGLPPPAYTSHMGGPPVYTAGTGGVPSYGFNPSTTGSSPYSAYT